MYFYKTYRKTSDYYTLKYKTETMIKKTLGSRGFHFTLSVSDILLTCYAKDRHEL